MTLSIYNSGTPRVDLWIRAGDTFTKEFIVKVNGAVLDLTGHTVRSQVRAANTSATVMVTPTVTISDATAGELTWSLTPAQTAALTADSQVYDVETTAPDGTVTTRVEGRVLRVRDVTRS